MVVAQSKRWETVERLMDIGQGFGVYLIAFLGSFASRYVDDYMTREEFTFDFSWEVLIMTGILSIGAALLSDWGGDGKPKRKRWKVRALNALMFGLAIDATIGRFVASAIGA